MYPTYPKLGMRHEAYDDLVSSNRPRLLLTITRLGCIRKSKVPDRLWVGVDVEREPGEWPSFHGYLN